tara:strand:- start:435 stop:707 length:273 start_codon:yes stop_codon:yes gene_type:complete
MRRFKLIRLKGSMEASAWDSVSVADNNIKMAFDSADFVEINNLETSYSLDFGKRPNKFTICAFKRKLLPNNSSNNSSTSKTSTINSPAGD